MALFIQSKILEISLEIKWNWPFRFGPTEIYGTIPLTGLFIFGRSDRNFPLHLISVVLSTALLYPTFKNNNHLARGGLGRGLSEISNLNFCWMESSLFAQIHAKNHISGSKRLGALIRHLMSLRFQKHGFNMDKKLHIPGYSVVKQDCTLTSKVVVVGIVCTGRLRFLYSPVHFLLVISYFVTQIVKCSIWIELKHVCIRCISLKGNLGRVWVEQWTRVLSKHTFL